MEIEYLSHSSSNLMCKIHVNECGACAEVVCLQSMKPVSYQAVNESHCRMKAQ